MILVGINLILGVYQMNFTMSSAIGRKINLIYKERHNIMYLIV